MLWEAIKLANQSVRRNVLRSILTLLGIVIGVSAVIAMVTIGNGTTQKVTEDLSKLGSNMLVARPGRETFGGGGGDVRSFTERNVATLRSELAEVRGIAPTATRAARVVYGAENYDTTVTGTESDFFLVQDWSFESGRPFTDGDIRSASSVCVIGQTVKTVLFGQADPLGLRLRLGGLSCEVIGVLNGKGQSAFGSDQDNTVVMPLRTFQRRIAGNQRISTIYIAAASTDSIPTVQAAAADILREQRRVAQDEESDFSVRDMTQMVSTLTSTTTAMTDAAHHAVLNDAQQLRLKRQRHLGELVEEERSAVRHLEQTDLVAIGAGERALPVTEHLGLEQMLGHGGAVDRHEAALRAAAVLVDELRDHLLTRAALADEHDRRIGRRDLAREIDRACGTPARRRAA